MQALMLAAGMGKRLKKYTNDNTKCMLEVAGKKLIDRAIESIKKAKIKRFVLVIGYKGEELRRYIEEKYLSSDIEFVFIENRDYATTNNIYSLWLARNEMSNDDTILLESDLIFEDKVISDMVKNSDKNLVAVAKYQEWMDGTVVLLDTDKIKQMLSKKMMVNELISQYYKTVNIYKFSKEFFSNIYLPFMEAYQKAVGKNSYYESVLSCILNIDNVQLSSFDMSDTEWYEIDDEQDLEIAEAKFSKGKEKYEKTLSKWGGYWRYNLIDAAFLVNPYFPTNSMIDKIKRNFQVLISQYPSCLSLQNLNAARIFNIEKEKIIVGNGAAELINNLGQILANKKIAVSMPVFNEYIRCFKNSELVFIDNSQVNYEFNYDEFYANLDKVDCVMIVTPDNPTGFHIPHNKLIEMIASAKEKKVQIVVDESFADFADHDKKYSLISDEILDRYPNLVVIKSISKSYGNPGLRLGILASSDLAMIEKFKSLMAIWNINSFAEYYLQIHNLYAQFYTESCHRIAEERNRISNILGKYKNIKVFDSQANYIMIELLEHSSKQVAIKMLEDDKILVKDLSEKKIFKKHNFMRIAVKSEEENNLILKSILKHTNNCLD